MDVKIKKKAKPTKKQLPKDSMDAAYSFAKKAHKEYGNLIKALVLFGTVARNRGHSQQGKVTDIDILIIIDDVSIYLSRELVQAYRIITKRLILETDRRLHITSMRLTSFWEYVRAGDPIVINILRDGQALMDTGFFDPLQMLLYQGRIRPTSESIMMYFSKVQPTLANSKWHLLQATVDLYWAVIDAAHAALMKNGETPPTPAHVGDMLEEKLVKTKLLERKYAKTMKKFYKIAKQILHREVSEVKGPEYDRYYKEATEFTDRMKRFIEKK